MMFQGSGKDRPGSRAQGVSASPAAADAALTPVGGTRTATAVPKILYVEDNDDNIYLIRIQPFAKMTVAPLPSPWDVYLISNSFISYSNVSVNPFLQ